MAQFLVQDEIREWVSKSDVLFIKKLSRNDCGWADGPEFGHQNGTYIPREIREAGFFPTLQNVNPNKSHIYEARFNTIWPSSGEVKTSKLKHYSNKGTEMHFTGVPKDEFAGLTPASLLIGGRLKTPLEGEVQYWFVVVDSASPEAELLESNFDLAVDFHFGLFAPSNALNIPQDDTELLIREIDECLKNNTLKEFIASAANLPAPSVLAAEAQSQYLARNKIDSLNPYLLENPGDAIMQISRDIEYKLYKRAELRHRAAEVIRIITRDKSSVVSSIVRGFSELDATFLSASQHRKSRAGRSFEQHIGRLLRDGAISFEEQAVTGGRRPDFVLPNVQVMMDAEREYDEALVLSAKTTLRERWKQITLEKFNCSLYLATVDDRVSSDSIEDMNKHGICLVVPESLKKSKETCYNGKSNVITFRNFFDSEISSKRPSLRFLTN